MPVYKVFCDGCRIRGASGEFGHAKREIAAPDAAAAVQEFRTMFECNRLVVVHAPAAFSAAPSPVPLAGFWAWQCGWPGHDYRDRPSVLPRGRFEAVCRASHDRPELGGDRPTNRHADLYMDDILFPSEEAAVTAYWAAAAAAAATAVDLFAPEALTKWELGGEGG